MILTFMQIGMRLVEVDPRFVLELIPTSKLPNTDAVALLKLSIIAFIFNILLTVCPGILQDSASITAPATSVGPDFNLDQEDFNPI